MKQEDFAKLPSRVQMTLMIAMEVRGAIEAVHIKYIPQEEMPELNRKIRQAIYDILQLTHMASTHRPVENQEGWQQLMGRLIRSIPDYWELPKNNIKKYKEGL